MLIPDPVQDIYKDPYPANIWNHAAARIIHVHMLDPVSCEKVTHVVPIPPPMDVETYAEMGGEFYVVEEKVDQRLEGGDFDNVKSVSQMDELMGLSTEEDFDPLKPRMCRQCERRLCDCMCALFYLSTTEALWLTYPQHPTLRPPILQRLHPQARGRRRARLNSREEELEMSILQRGRLACSRILRPDEFARRRADAYEGSGPRP